MGGIAVEGEHAYLVVGPRIEVLDARDPRKLARVGRTPTLSRELGGTGDIAAEESVVALSNGNGVLFVDARNPSAPTEAGWVPVRGQGGRVVGRQGTFAVLVKLDFGHSYAIQLIDASDPHRPQLGGLIYIYGYAPSLWIEDDTLWALSRSSATNSETGDQNPLTGETSMHGTGLRRIDVSDPHNPREIPIGALVPEDDVYPALAVDGDTLYVMEDVDVADDKRVAKLRVLGVNSEAPELAPLGTWTGELFSEIWESWYSYLAGKRLVIAPNTGYADEIVQVFDIADPQAPKALPDLNKALAQPDCTSVGPPAVSGDLLWLPCRDGLRVLDMADGATERQVGSYRPTDEPVLQTSTTAFSGDLLWTVVEGPEPATRQEPAPSVIAGWDLAGSGEPRLVASFPAKMGVSALAADGPYLYLAGNYWGDLRVMDVRDPAKPVEVAMLERATKRKACEGGDGMHPCVMQGVTGATVAGDKLFIGYSVGAADGDVEVLDVRDPAHPVVKGWVVEGYHAELGGGQSTGDAFWAVRSGEMSTDLVAVDADNFEPGKMLVVPQAEGAIGACLAAVGDRAFAAQLLPKPDAATATPDGTGPKLVLRALEKAADGTVRATGTLTVTQLSIKPDDTSAYCSMAGDGDLVALSVSSNDLSQPDLFYLVDVSDPAHMVIRYRYRGDDAPAPFALRGRTLYGLSAAGLTRWAIEP